MKNWFKFIFQNWLGPPKSIKSSRLQIEDVKAGDMIKIEWDNIKGRIGDVTCLSNDPIERKMYVQMRWSNWADVKHLPGYEEMEEFEEFIIDYNSYHLKNFHLLNTAIIPEKEEKQKGKTSLDKEIEKIKTEIGNG